MAAWTNDRTNFFFTDPDQMSLPVLTIPGLVLEGIEEVDDLLDFNDKDFKTVRENLQRSAGRVPDPANAGQTIPAPGYVFGAKAYKRLKIAATAARYYETIGRPMTYVNMHFVNVLKGFTEQWESLEAKKAETPPAVPTITRALPIVKRTEAMNDFLHQVVGSSMIPLAYLFRDDENAAVPAPALLANERYSEAHGSIEGELIARASHTHNKFRDDNAKLFSYLEIATRTTQYASSIRPFARTKNGRGAYLALIAQYAGKDKWQEELKKQEQFICNRYWKGNSNFSLESFITQHRSADISMQRCAEYVEYQLPTERTRVIHLLDAIQTSDAPLQAALARIRSDDGVGGMMSDFEAATAYLLQFDPVAKKRKQGGPGRQHQVSFVDQNDGNTGDFEMKPNKGKSGVELRYYNHDEYQTLTNDQKLELKEFRKDKKRPGKEKQTGKGKRQKTSNGKTRDEKAVFTKSMKKHIISCLKELNAEAQTAEASNNETRDYILSVVGQQKKSSIPPRATTPAPQPPSALQRILTHASSNKEE